VLTVSEGDRSVTVEKGNDFLQVKTGFAGTEVEGDFFVNSNKVIRLVATEEILLVVGGSQIRLTPTRIDVNGSQFLDLTGSDLVKVQSKFINLN